MLKKLLRKIQCAVGLHNYVYHDDCGDESAACDHNDAACMFCDGQFKWSKSYSYGWHGNLIELNTLIKVKKVNPVNDLETESGVRKHFVETKGKCIGKCVKCTHGFRSCVCGVCGDLGGKDKE